MNTKTIETQRQFWAEIAKANGWYKEPFYVQVWVNEEGEIIDSVSSRNMTEDYIVREVRQECEDCGELHYDRDDCQWEY